MTVQKFIKLFLIQCLFLQAPCWCVVKNPTKRVVPAEISRDFMCISQACDFNSLQRQAVHHKPYKEIIKKLELIVSDEKLERPDRVRAYFDESTKRFKEFSKKIRTVEKNFDGLLGYARAIRAGISAIELGECEEVRLRLIVKRLFAVDDSQLIKVRELGTELKSLGDKYKREKFGILLANLCLFGGIVFGEAVSLGSTVTLLVLQQFIAGFVMLAVAVGLPIVLLPCFVPLLVLYYFTTGCFCICSEDSDSSDPGQFYYDCARVCEKIIKFKNIKAYFEDNKVIAPSAGSRYMLSDESF